jgi:hypothetical protein
LTRAGWVRTIWGMKWRKVRYTAGAAVGFVGGGVGCGLVLSRVFAGSGGGWGDIIGMVLGLVFGSGLGSGAVLVMAVRTRTRAIGAALVGFVAPVIGVFGVFLVAGMLGLSSVAFIVAMALILGATWVVTLNEPNTADGVGPRVGQH